MCRLQAPVSGRLVRIGGISGIQQALYIDQGLGQLGPGFDHLGVSTGNRIRGYATAGIEMDDHPKTGVAQLQHAGLDAVVGGEAADQYGIDLAGLQKFDEPCAAPFGQVVEAGAVGVQIRLDPLPDEEVVIDGGGQAIQQLEALGAGQVRSALGKSSGNNMPAGSLTAQAALAGWESLLPIRSVARVA